MSCGPQQGRGAWGLMPIGTQGVGGNVLFVSVGVGTRIVEPQRQRDGQNVVSHTRVHG